MNRSVNRSVNRAANRQASAVQAPLGELIGRIHRDQRGGVSIETVLILAAIALPVLIFVLKVGWPRVKEFFDQGLEDLQGTIQETMDGN